MRYLAALVAVFALAATFAACGGGGDGREGSSVSTRAASTPSTSAGPARTGATAAAAAPRSKASSVKPSASRKSGPSRAVVREAGHAAPFLVPTGDNSIPTYGAEAPPSEQAAATTALRVYLDARAGGEWAAACAHMAATVQKQLGALTGKQEPCAAAYAKLSSQVSASMLVSPLSGPIAALRVEGDRAFALFYGLHEQQYMMPMVGGGGAWKVSQIEAIPWPIGVSSGGG